MDVWKHDRASKGSTARLTELDDACCNCFVLRPGFNKLLHPCWIFFCPRRKKCLEQPKGARDNRPSCPVCHYYPDNPKRVDNDAKSSSRVARKQAPMERCRDDNKKKCQWHDK